MENNLAYRLLNFGLTAAAISVLLIGFFVIGPWIETKWFPVYSKFTIISVERLDDRQSKVVFKFTKYRQCDPQGYGWYFGEPGAAFRQLKVAIDGRTTTNNIRPIGIHISDEYTMDATVEEIASATFAEIYSRCHPFWLTRSEIFP